MNINYFLSISNWSAYSMYKFFKPSFISSVYCSAYGPTGPNLRKPKSSPIDLD